LCAAVIVFLNARLVVAEIGGWLAAGGATAVVLGAGIVALSLQAGAVEPQATCPDPVDRTAAVTHATSALCGATPTPACTTLVTALDHRVAAWRATHVEVCRATREGRQSAELLDLRMRCLDQQLREDDAFVAQLATTPLDRKAVFGALGALGQLAAPARCATVDRGGLYAAPPADRARAIAEAEGWLAVADADYSLGRYAAGLAALAPHFEAIRALAHPPLVAQTAKLLGELQREAGQLAAAEQTYDVGLKAAAQASDDVATAELLLDLAYLVGESRQEPARGAELLRAAEAAIVRAGNLPALESSLRIIRGGFAEQRGDFPAAVADFTRAVELRRGSVGPDAGDTAVALQRLCAAEGQTPKLEQAHQHCEQAVAILRHALGPDHPLVAEAESTLGIATAIQGDLEGARAQWESVLARLERALGPRSPDLVPVLLNLGDASSALKDPAAAERYLARAVELTGKGDRDANDLALRVRVARQLQASKPAAALAMLEDIVRRSEAQLGRDHPTTASALSELGASYYNAGRLAEARTTFERAIAAHRVVYGERHAVTLTLEGRYGQSLFELGELAAARAVYERVMLALEVTVPADSPFLGQAYSNFASAMIALHEPGASVYAAKGFAIREKLADDPLQLAEARFILGRALWRDRKDRTRAVALVKQARDEMRALGPDASSLPDTERWLAGRR
jgi:tetratricopeptide (TPR) repeat protein